jgi:hypothetical protein
MLVVESLHSKQVVILHVQIKKIQKNEIVESVRWKSSGLSQEQRLTNKTAPALLARFLLEALTCPRVLLVLADIPSRLRFGWILLHLLLLRLQRLLSPGLLPWAF